MGGRGRYPSAKKVKSASSGAVLSVQSRAHTLQGKPLGHRRVQRMVKQYAAKAGIVKNVSLHTLRHSLATDLYCETSKIHLVQKVLGHSDLSTTMIYTHIVDGELEDALKSFRQAAAVA